MGIVYSAYEAKARFSEVLRHVREGRSVTISYRGKPVAEICPIEERPVSFETRLDELRRRGIIQPPHEPRRAFERVAHIPGALQRFLENR